ncbi:MAG: hypothetical protein LBE31_01885 [Deltaproteobacteria bacterium]|jgi:hypothetical protein|nr:hypothetical protein [Deltaproteobacteria bacterium]
MPLLLIIGGFLILIGIALLITWFGVFIILIKILLPLVVIGLGALLAYFGWEEKKDRHNAFIDFSSPAEASRYQADALAYKEKIKKLSESSAETDANAGAIEAIDDAAAPLAIDQNEQNFQGETETPAVILEKAPADQADAKVSVTAPTE